MNMIFGDLWSQYGRLLQLCDRLAKLFSTKSDQAEDLVGCSIICVIDQHSSGSLVCGVQIARGKGLLGISYQHRLIGNGHAVIWAASGYRLRQQNILPKNGSLKNSTSDGTALSAGDYTSTSGTLTFLPNETSKTISVNINSDSSDEFDENFTIALSSATNATIGAISATTVTIVDDDHPVGAGPMILGTVPEHDEEANGERMFSCVKSCEIVAGADVTRGGFVLELGNFTDLFNDYGDSDAPGYSSSATSPYRTSLDNSGTLGSFVMPYYNSAFQQSAVIDISVVLPVNAAVANSYYIQINIEDDSPGGTNLPPVYYTNESGGTTISPTDELCFSIQVDTSAMASGQYKYSAVLTAVYAGGTASLDSTGYLSVFSGSEYDGFSYDGLLPQWSIAELDRLYIQANGLLDGALLVRGDATTTWFAKSGNDYVNGSADSFSGLIAETYVDRNNVSNDVLTLTNKYNEKYLFADTNGRLLYRLDMYGNERSYNYASGSDRIETVTDVFGRDVSFSYDGGGNIDEITDFSGRVVDFDVTDDKVTDVTYPDPDAIGMGEPAPKYSFTYHDSGEETGLLHKIQYDVTKAVDAAVETRTIKIDYNKARQFSQMTNADGSLWTLETTQAVTLAYVGATNNGSTTSLATDLVKCETVKATYTDELGNQTFYKIDGFGNLSEVTDALANTTTYERYSNGQLKTIKEPAPEGMTGTVDTAYVYDSLGNATTITFADATSISLEYDSLGPNNTTKFSQVTKVIDELGRETHMVVGLTGVIDQVTEVVGEFDTVPGDDLVTTYTYTNSTTTPYDLLPSGMLLSVVDAEGKTTTFDYYHNLQGQSDTRHGWLKSITYNSGGTTEIVESFDYDTYGNITSHVQEMESGDEDDRRTDYVYDKLNRLTATIEASTYDPVIIDNGAAAKTGTWTPNNTIGYCGNSDYGSGTETATWTFSGLTNGATYDVFATWDSAASSNEG